MMLHTSGKPPEKVSTVLFVPSDVIYIKRQNNRKIVITILLKKSVFVMV